VKRLSNSIVVSLICCAATGAAQAADPVTKFEDWGALVAPFTVSLGNSFSDLDRAQPGIQIAPLAVPITLQSTDDFVDYYRFSVDAVQATSIVGTIDLGTSLNINALRLRLLADSGLSLAALGANSPLTSQPALISATGGSEVQRLDLVDLPAGHYLMEVRGQVIGTAGGSYSGVLNLSPVPDVNALGLAMAGLVVLRFIRRS